MKWTAKKPDRNGWWWMRTVCGSIATDRPVEVMQMRYTVERAGRFFYRNYPYLSIYYNEQWRDIKTVGNDARTRWSDAPIRAPLKESD